MGTEGEQKRKMVSMRLRVGMIKILKEIRDAIKKETGKNYSLGTVIEMTIASSREKKDIRTLLKEYNKTFEIS